MDVVTFIGFRGKKKVKTVHMDAQSSGSWKSLVELLQLRARETPDSMAYTFLKDGLEEDLVYTYEELDRHAKAIAATLGDVKGARALLIYPPGAEFVAGFLGTLYAGAIPIPAPPPDIARLKRTLPRLRSIILDADASLMVTTSGIADSLLGGMDDTIEFPQMRWLSTDLVDIAKADEWAGAPDIHEDDIAYLQYTSGSTSTPKGVMITHKNIKANSAVIYQGFGYDSNSVEVTWMPYFHDYGLVDGLIQPLYVGIPCYILSPLTFLRRPERWLEVISRVRGTHTQAPNFAYEQCIRRIDDKLLETLDLSCMITASSGGEPIRSETVRGFRDKFAVCGLKPEAVCPAYGLAETTLLVSAKTRTGPPVFCSVDDEAFKSDKVIEVDPDDMETRSRSVVSCGIILDTVDVAIVDGENETTLPDGMIGEVWVGGDSIGAGYWQHPEESERTFRARLADDPKRGPFLRTGDLGFVLRNNLYITGRQKDLIIIAGVNHYPQDIEWTVQEAVDAVRTDHCVAFSVDVDGEERLVVVAEAAKNLKDWEPVLSTIRREISENHEVELYALHMIRRGTILKTSSGKLRRGGCRTKFLKDKFDTRFTWRKKTTIPAKPDITAAKSESHTLKLRGRFIQEYLTGLISANLGLPENSIDINRPLAEYGLTSRAAVAIVGQIESWLNINELSSTLLWEYPTIASLSLYLEAGESKMKSPEAKHVSHSEPLAIVGISCRFPLAENPDEFWDLLTRGVDAVSNVPEDRWKSHDYFSEESGKRGYINNRHGGFIKDVDKFDAAFFDISPSEAEMMDPQQRLLLELAWESFESAGMDPSGPDGAGCGVFIGISTNDYADLQMADRYRMNPYTGPGKSASIAANRISYLFNLQGPSMAIDTACSSSLVALHQARHALQNGDCRSALVGGVNLLLSPKMSVALAQAGMLSTKGTCTPFDASADGYIRSEGGGMVVLKRLSDAEKDGDRIFSVLRGSAINQDGRSNGLTAPNGLAQQAVVQRAIADSGLKPDQIQYVEAHGTGTPLGDPIEISSLQKVLSIGRKKDGVCSIGSVKSNIGHLEAAAGIAGLIKVVLSLWHRQIPANANFKELNELIRLKDTPFTIADTLQPWMEEERIAGISSFGFGGANAHAILSSAPMSTNGKITSLSKPDVSRINGSSSNGQKVANHYLLPISARSPKALTELAERYSNQLTSDDETSISDICYSASVTRPGFEHRLVVAGSSKKEISDDLIRFIDKKPGGWIHQAGGNERPKTVWLFTGQGSQYTGMGKQLYESESLFKDEIDRCNNVLKPLLGQNLNDLLWDEVNSEKLNSTRFTQPALFALQVSLAKLLMNQGVIPDAVTGYSVGEFAAAAIAGIISVEDGLLLTAERGRLVDVYASDGGMAAIKSDVESVKNIIKSIDGVELATLNGPAGQVISGKPDSIKEALKQFETKGIESRMLNVSHAFHSALMEPAVKPFAEVARSVNYFPASIPILSNLSGLFGGAEMSGADYWVDHLRKPVLFGEGMQQLLDEEYNTFVEIGPKPVLLGMVGQLSNTEQCHFIPTLRPDVSDRQQLLTATGNLWARGGTVDWKAVYKSISGKKVTLPVYPFDRRRYWLDTDSIEEGESGAVTESERAGNLVGEKIESPLLPVTLFQSEFSLKRLPFYREHRVFGEVVVPAAGHMSLLLQAAKSLYNRPECRINNLIFPQPLIIPADEKKRVQLAVDHAGSSGEQSFKLISWQSENRLNTGSGNNTNHNEHVRGLFKPIADTNLSEYSNSSRKPESNGHSTSTESVTLEEIKNRCKKRENVDFYTSIWQSHIQLGNHFRLIKSLLQGENEVLVELDANKITTSGEGPELYPGLLDSALQAMTALVDLDEEEAMVPFSVDELIYFGRISNETLGMWSHMTLSESEGDMAVADVRIVEVTKDGGERTVAKISGFRVRKVGKIQLLRDLNRDYNDHLYHIEWEQVALKPTEDHTGRWLCWLDCDNESDKQLLLSSVSNGVGISSIQEFEQELEKEDVAGILFGLGAELNGRADSDKLESVVSTLMDLVKVMDHHPVPLVLLTSEAQTLQQNGKCEPAQTALWGLGRVIQREMPHLSCRLLDMDSLSSVNGNIADSDSDHSKRNDYVSFLPDLHALVSDENITESVYRDEVLYQARLMHTQPVHRSQPDEVLINSDAEYLVTGGLGNLGLNLAEWLVEQGAGVIRLIGRSEPDKEQAERVAEMNRSGTVVITNQVDVSDREALKKLFDEIAKQDRPLKGIFHLAGVIDDGPLNQQSWSRFKKVLAPKMNGTWNLHELSRNLGLDHFVVYSSASSVLGTPGQSGYAMANAFTDGLIQLRRSEGLTGMVVNWGPWMEGMASGLRDEFENRGIQMMDTRRAASTLENLMKAKTVGQAIVIPTDWDQFEKHSGVHPLYKHLRTVLPESSDKPRLSSLLESAGHEEKWQILEEQIRELVSAFLHISDPSSIQGRKRLFELGLDSLGAVELKNRISSALDKDQRSTLLFDFPTIEDLVDYLGSKVLGWTKVTQEAESNGHSDKKDTSSYDDLSEEDLAELLAEELGDKIK